MVSRIKIKWTKQKKFAIVTRCRWVDWVVLPLYFSFLKAAESNNNKQAVGSLLLPIQSVRRLPHLCLGNSLTNNSRKKSKENEEKYPIGPLSTGPNWGKRKWKYGKRNVASLSVPESVQVLKSAEFKLLIKFSFRSTLCDQKVLVLLLQQQQHKWTRSRSCANEEEENYTTSFLTGSKESSRDSSLLIPLVAFLKKARRQSPIGILKKFNHATAAAGRIEDTKEMSQ